MWKWLGDQGVRVGTVTALNQYCYGRKWKKWERMVSAPLAPLYYCWQKTLNKKEKPNQPWGQPYTQIFLQPVPKCLSLQAGKPPCDELRLVPAGFVSLDAGLVFG